MNFDALAFRVYVAVEGLGLTHLLRRVPRLARNASQLRKFVLSDTPKWRKVRSGISEGLWMQLQLPKQGRLWRGEHELRLQKAILAAISPETVFYDIGAHEGSIALGVAQRLNRSGCVVAFEADPQNAQSLRSNAERNNLTSSLQVVSRAVWSYSTPGIGFRRGGTQSTHGGVEADGQHPVLSGGEMIAIPAIALDDFVASGGRVPQLVKIDVEGGEYEVLCGGTELFTKHRPIIVVEVHHERAASQIGPWLTRVRYASRWIVPAERFPSCLFAWPEEFDGAAWMRRSGAEAEPCQTT